MFVSEASSRRRRGTRLALTCVTLLAGSAAVAASSGSASAASDHTVFLGFDDVASGAPASTGSVPVTTDVTSSGGAVLGSADGVNGSAADFPPWDGSTSPYKRVAVTVTSDSSADPLSPGGRSFSFGADFSLDPRTEGGNDNGNNLIQRGLYGDPAQYKLQVDHGYVSCRIRGSQGTSLVKSDTAVAPNTWYSATCSRSGSVVTLSVRRIGGSTDTKSTDGSVGSVDLGSASVPLAIGAKANRGGSVVTGNADQLNGLLDNVFVDIG